MADRRSSSYPNGTPLTITDCHGKIRDKGFARGRCGPYSLYVELKNGGRISIGTELIVRIGHDDVDQDDTPAPGEEAQD